MSKRKALLYLMATFMAFMVLIAVLSSASDAAHIRLGVGQTHDINNTCKEESAALELATSTERAYSDEAQSKVYNDLIEAGICIWTSWPIRVTLTKHIYDFTGSRGTGEVWKVSSSYGDFFVVLITDPTPVPFV